MRVWTPYGDLSYPALDAPRDYGHSGAPKKYSACLVLPFGWWDLDSDLLCEIARVGLDYHRTLDFRLPVRYDDRHAPYRHPRAWAQSIHRPARTPFMEFYPGVRCRFLVEPFAWRRSGIGRGVALTLLAVEAGMPAGPAEQLARETARLAEETARLARATADLARMQSYRGEME